MISAVDYIGVEEEVRIVFTDGQYVIGRISSVDDEEESELGEVGLSVFTREGGYLGIAESEVERIDILQQ